MSLIVVIILEDEEDEEINEDILLPKATEDETFNA